MQQILYKARAHRKFNFSDLYKVPKNEHWMVPIFLQAYNLNWYYISMWDTYLLGLNNNIETALMCINKQHNVSKITIDAAVNACNNALLKIIDCHSVTDTTIHHQIFNCNHKYLHVMMIKKCPVSWHIYITPRMVIALMNDGYFIHNKYAKRLRRQHEVKKQYINEIINDLTEEMPLYDINIITPLITSYLPYID